MTDKLYTQSDMEALRERCAKVAEEEYESHHRSGMKQPPNSYGRAENVACSMTADRIATDIRALTLHPEGEKP